MSDRGVAVLDMVSWEGHGGDICVKIWKRQGSEPQNYLGEKLSRQSRKDVQMPPEAI